MAISGSISRLAAYYKRHGLSATLRRFGLAARRALFFNRMVLFYCDLSTLISSTAGLPNPLKVERHKTQTDITGQDLEEITSFWNAQLARRNISQRFALGASLWLIRSEGQLAGYGWSLRGHTVEPHYFLLGQDDVHLFDFQVFPKYRGQGLNPLLVGHILQNLALECRGRVFIEAAEWNRPQLSSLRRTPFRRLGLAGKITLLRRTIVSWDELRSNKIEQERQIPLKNMPMVASDTKSAEIKGLQT
jgi:GNAT superfamily N-acetyltransferase